MTPHRGGLPCLFLFRSGAWRGAAGFTIFDHEIHGAARRNQNRAGGTSRAEAQSAQRKTKKKRPAWFSLQCYSEELRIFGKFLFSLRALRLCAILGRGGIWLRRAALQCNFRKLFIFGKIFCGQFSE